MLLDYRGGFSEAPVTIARAATLDQDSLRKSSVHRAPASTGWQIAGPETTEEATGKFPSGPEADAGGGRLRTAPWVGGETEAAKAQLDGRMPGIPEEGGWQGTGELCDQMFALPPGRKAL